MLDLGWTELLVIGVLTILIFGPKELPVVFRTVTHWLGKARSVAREFQRTVEDMARDTELDEVRKAAKNAASDMNSMVDPSGSLDGLFDDPDKRKAGQPQSMPDAPRDSASDNDDPTAWESPAPASDAPAAQPSPNAIGGTDAPRQMDDAMQPAAPEPAPAPAPASDTATETPRRSDGA
ncbi:MAG: Sec-independent protein translocase protein TatB [Minwuia sp.]|nr:Sec-independent protein translocase protein TatB [Minwuia sp.]